MKHFPALKVKTQPVLKTFEIDCTKPVVIVNKKRKDCE